MIKEVKVGADPELFAFKKNAYVGVHNVLEGSKDNPFKVNDGAVQVDGLAAEFNIDPCLTKGEFVRKIFGVKRTIQNIIQARDPDIVLVCQPHVDFHKKYWDTVPAFNKVLGCDPDYNAYTKKANPRPDPEKLGRPTLRTGSGHLHIGWKTPEKMTPEKEFAHFEDCCKIVQLLDQVILPQEHIWDKTRVRRNLYGQPGAFRPKPYGVEYRVLSNKWVDNPVVAGWLFDVCRQAPFYLKDYKRFYGVNHFYRWVNLSPLSVIIKREELNK